MKIGVSNWLGKVANSKIPSSGVGWSRTWSAKTKERLETLTQKKMEFLNQHAEDTFDDGIEFLGMLTRWKQKLPLIHMIQPYNSSPIKR